MASLNIEQIQNIAGVIAELPAGEALNFYSALLPDGQALVLDDMYPPLNHPHAIDFFFFGTMHDFGFWYGDHQGYREPLFGTMDGKRAKGSDFLWRACRKVLREDAAVFSPSRLARLTVDEFALLFSDDRGPMPWPDFETRFRLSVAYGAWFTVRGTSPVEMVRGANVSSQPLSSFLSLTGSVPGYNADAFLKKNLLLAMALANRPERFLTVIDDDHWHPIVDYHLMRVALRMGLVVLDEQERSKNHARSWVSSAEEERIRAVTAEAVKLLIQLSGKAMADVDKVLWMARKYCPEMEMPKCEQCLFRDQCTRRVELFQPVIRTISY